MATTMLILPSLAKMTEIYRDLGLTEDKIDVEVDTIKEWMRKQAHLPDPAVDERRIRMFLILCKNSLERTKEALDQYYTLKTLVPEFFAERDPTSPTLLKSMETSMFIPLPQLTKEGYRISLCFLRNSTVENFEFSDFVKVNFMSMDIRLSKLDLYKKEIFIFDLSKFTMSHLTTVLPHIKKFFYIATTAYPVRIHEVHILNMPGYAQPMVNLVLSVLKKKIANRIMIHNDMKDLLKHVSAECLPTNYGGVYPKTTEEIAENWKNELVEHRDWFLSQNSVVCDESRRTKKGSIKMDMLSGVEGSFRKLEVD